MQPALIVAVVVVIIMVIALAMYFMGRTSSGSNSSSQCGTGAHCVFPARCVNGACADPELGQLLTDAQVAANDLTNAVRALAGPDTGVVARANNFIAEGAKLGLSPPAPSIMTALSGDLQAGQNQVSAYLRTLAVPTVGKAEPRGYYAQIMALSPKSVGPVASGQFMSVAQMARPAAIGARAISDALTPAAADLQNVYDAVNNQYVSKGINPLSAMNLMSAGKAMLADMAAMRGDNIVALADIVQRTGDALYAHFTGPV